MGRGIITGVKQHLPPYPGYLPGRHGYNKFQVLIIKCTHLVVGVGIGPVTGAVGPQEVLVVDVVCVHRNFVLWTTIHPLVKQPNMHTWHTKTDWPVLWQAAVRGHLKEGKKQRPHKMDDYWGRITIIKIWVESAHHIHTENMFYIKICCSTIKNTQTCFTSGLLLCQVLIW